MLSTRRALLVLAAGLSATMVMGAGPKKTIAPTKLKAASAAQIRANLGLTGSSGWILVDMATGKVIDQGNADRPFVPASVAKLPTAAFALDALGPHYRFETRVRANGAISGGRVKGDLVLEGGGDPELDTKALAAIAAALKERGIKRVDGRFLADGSALPQVPQIESSQAVDAPYNPAVSGLNLNFNRVHVKWDARKGRKKLSVEAEGDRMTAPVDRIRVALASGKGLPTFSLTLKGGREYWSMHRRAYRGRAARWLPVKGATAYTAEVFRTVCARAGLKLPQPQIGPAAKSSRVLAIYQSRPLGEILRAMLKYSTNVTAEVSGAAATRATGLAADSLGASADVMNAWAAGVAGFEIGDPGFKFVNHSGLSLRSRVSPRRMAQLLVALARRSGDPGVKHPRVPGSIAGYLKPHNVAAKKVPLDYENLTVVAKTGTMSYVRGLAGYIVTPRGRKLAFAIFSNDLKTRGNGAQRVNRRWSRRAKSFERALIRSWVIRVDGQG